MRKYRKSLLFSILCLFSLNTINAQQAWEAGGWLGVSHYFGELNPAFNMTRPGIAGGLTARYLFNNRLSFKSSLNYAFISGTDEGSSNPFEQARNLHFRSSIFDLSNQFEFNFLPYVHGTKEYFSPYLFGGLSVFSYNPQAELEGKWYNLREYGTEGQILGEEYLSYGLGLLYGAGVKWDINYRLSLNIEVGARLLATDYLDDVSTVYPNRGEVQSLRGDIGVALSNPSTLPGFGTQGTQRGNSTDNDSYMTTGISIMYYFGQLKCPPILRY